MRIRTATPSDATQLARVHVSSWQTTYRSILPDSYLDALDPAAREPSWRERLATPDTGTCTLVAENEQGKILGFAAAGPERDDASDYDCEIYAIYLLEEYRRRGLGRRLMAACARWLQMQGYREVLIWVLEANANARAFYEALDGQLAGRKPITIGATTLTEVSYGWPDLHMLSDLATGLEDHLEADPS